MVKQKKNKKRNYVFDFDSTFITVEALEELASIALDGREDKQEVIREIEEITHLGIEGGISFSESLSRRIKLAGAHKDHLEKLVKVLSRKVSVSVKRNKQFFKDHTDQVYIVSAGFHEFIEPIVEKFGIKKENVFANTFEYNEQGAITGYDSSNPLSRSDGKQERLKSLKLKGEVYVIGDGYSDFRMKSEGGAQKFFAFTENIERDSAVASADHVAPNLDEFLFQANLPRAHSYPKNRIKVLLLENIHEDAQTLFLEEGYQVELLSTSLTEDELCEKIKGVSIIGIRSKTHITPKVLNAANQLLAVGAFCIGTNQIDLDACLQNGVAVFNAPFSNTRSVVELVIGEIILLMRKIPDKNRLLHEGKWLKSAEGSREIRGKTLGIIGYGNIGAQLSVLAESLGMHVMYYDRVDKLALGNAKKCKTLRELLRKSDVISLHVDGDPINEKLIGKQEIAAMKEDAVLINLSRGFVVDLNELKKALQSGKLKGAAVDVFPKEPKSNNEAIQTPLQGLSNVILTPHIGGSTSEAQRNIAEFVPSKIISYVNTGSTSNSVNFPNLQLPEQKNAHRLIHIHNNMPGILAKINRIMADHHINIVGQYLKTNEEVGYVITDIGNEYDEELLREELKNIEHTIKFRVLY